MLLDMFAVLFGGAGAMLPAFADQVLHTDARGLGALRSAPAMGAVITALLLAVHPLRHIRGRLLLIVVAGFGVSIIGFGLSHSFWLCMVLLAASGAFDSVSMVIRGTLLQWLTPDAMRGRVSAVGSMFIISSNEIGAFESGVAATLLGLVPSIVFGGVGTLIVVAVTALASPKLRRLAVNTEEST
jgi:predicted MFS family arabinose efflux permease